MLVLALVLVLVLVLVPVPVPVPVPVLVLALVLVLVLVLATTTTTVLLQLAPTPQPTPRELEHYDCIIWLDLDLSNHPTITDDVMERTSGLACAYVLKGLGASWLILGVESLGFKGV